MQGKECNGVYDGYSYQSLWLGHSYATNFSHLHDFQPHSLNHTVPHHGIFSRLYFTRMLDMAAKQDKDYSSFSKDQGPPYKSVPQEFDQLEHNQYLQKHSIDPSELVHANRQN